MFMFAMACFQSQEAALSAEEVRMRIETELAARKEQEMKLQAELELAIAERQRLNAAVTDTAAAAEKVDSLCLEYRFGAL